MADHDVANAGVDRFKRGRHPAHKQGRRQQGNEQEYKQSPSALTNQNHGRDDQQNQKAKPQSLHQLIHTGRGKSKPIAPHHVAQNVRNRNLIKSFLGTRKQAR